MVSSVLRWTACGSALLHPSPRLMHGFIVNGSKSSFETVCTLAQSKYVPPFSIPGTHAVPWAFVRLSLRSSNAITFIVFRHEERKATALNVQ